MCIVVAPAVMMGVMAATAVASTAMTVMAAQQQAEAQSASMKYQAQVAENNAKVADIQVQLTNEAGQGEEQAKRLNTAALIGHSRAVAAASGTDPNTGSNVDIIESEAQTGEIDALQIRSNTARRAFGYQVQGMSDRAQSQLDMAGAGFAESQGQFAMFNSILSGASSLAGKWSNWQMQGGGNGKPAPVLR